MQYTSTSDMQQGHKVTLIAAPDLSWAFTYTTVFIPHLYGSLWRWKHWSVRQT